MRSTLLLVHRPKLKRDLAAPAILPALGHGGRQWPAPCLRQLQLAAINASRMGPPAGNSRVPPNY